MPETGERIRSCSLALQCCIFRRSRSDDRTRGKAQPMRRVLSLAVHEPETVRFPRVFAPVSANSLRPALPARRASSFRRHRCVDSSLPPSPPCLCCCQRSAPRSAEVLNHCKLLISLSIRSCPGISLIRPRQAPQQVTSYCPARSQAQKVPAEKTIHNAAHPSPE